MNEEQVTKKREEISQGSFRSPGVNNKQENGGVLNVDEKNEMREFLQNKKSFKSSRGKESRTASTGEKLIYTSIFSLFC